MREKSSVLLHTSEIELLKYIVNCDELVTEARCKTNYNFSMKQLGILNKKYYIQTMIYEMLML